MTDRIAHRGPDGEGHYLCDSVGLGHRRLAIIDLTPSGKQPMSNENGSIWVTYNGEIYNYPDVRRELMSRGHRFRSTTDTEVLIHAYEEWGVACLSRLNGMFAFGLWDGQRRKLWLARDRLGVKPLFYYYSHEKIVFGSEIKAILAEGSVPRELDYEALAYYLALNYTPAPHTLFATIRQLLPGRFLMIEADGKMQEEAYWNLVYREEERFTRQHYVEELTALLEDSVRLRLVSDVPFGAFLSGGLDSSSVCYWMSRHLREPVKTFSIGFGEESFDELEYARLTARAVGADHHERIVTADAAAVLPELVWHAEEPTADSSMVAVYYLARMTREHVAMALSGDGADEILAGYETYQAYYLHRLYNLLPRWARQRVISPLVHSLPASFSKASLDSKLKRFVDGADLPAEDAHAAWRMIFNKDARRALLSPLGDRPELQADAIHLFRSVFAETNARHPLNRLLYVDTRFYLPNDMLVKVDRMTMAHGLEAREPMLDYRLVEFAASVPHQFKLRHFHHKKYLLKAAMHGRLPAGIVWRKKAGFNVPNARWIRQGLKPFVTDHLSQARLQPMGLFDGRVVESILHDHFEGREDNSHQIWSLLTLAIWWQRFIEERDVN